MLTNVKVKFPLLTFDVEFDFSSVELVGIDELFFILFSDAIKMMIWCRSKIIRYKEIFFMLPTFQGNCKEKKLDGSKLKNLIKILDQDFVGLLEIVKLLKTKEERSLLFPEI